MAIFRHFPIYALSAAILENGGKFSTDGQYLPIHAETVHPTTTMYRNKVVERTILYTFGPIHFSCCIVCLAVITHHLLALAAAIFTNVWRVVFFKVFLHLRDNRASYNYTVWEQSFRPWKCTYFWPITYRFCCIVAPSSDESKHYSHNTRLQPTRLEIVRAELKP